MMVQTVLALSAALSAAGAGFIAWREIERLVRKRRNVRRVCDAQADRERFAGLASGGEGEGGLEDRVIGLAVDRSRRIALSQGVRLVPPKLAGGAWIESHAVAAGLGGKVTAEGFCETRARLALLGCAAGFAFGAILSIELAIVSGVAGAAFGWTLLRRSVERRIRWRVRDAERHLPEMLEVVALGMRSGLSFDRSLSLYAEHFDTALSYAFHVAQQQWTRGLVLRDEALRGIARTYDSPLLSRVVETMVRSLRFGSSMAETLEAAAAEARAAYRASKQEEAAKAPVKMMVPTGALILPAMLIMVLGPVLLDLAEGF